jgi:hypothetical protein
MQPIFCTRIRSVGRVTVVLCLLISTAAATDGVLTACNCNDLARLKDRLRVLEGIKTLVANKLKSADPKLPATQADWSALQSLEQSYLQALRMQNLSASDSTLFNGNDDPSCGTEPSASKDACFDQELSVHHQAHAASCQAGTWNWQFKRTLSAMLQEELSALQAEIDAIKKTIDALPCQPCPQFIVLVQVVTTTAISNSAIQEQSVRSLNNGLGIPVALVIHPDGTFEGFGAGADTGSGVGVSGPEVVKSQFGHLQAISATGTIRPGTSQDMMHLVLYGGSSTQVTTAQARGQVNRDLRQMTPTGAATMQFDLPAYVGSSAQRTLSATSMINSLMQVKIVQASNGAPPVPEGGSILYSVQSCKASTGTAQDPSKKPAPN